MLINLLELFWIGTAVFVYILVLFVALLDAHYKNKNKEYIELMFISHKDNSAKNIYFTFDKTGFYESFLSVMWLGLFAGMVLYVLQYKFRKVNFQLDINGITDVVMGLSSIVIGVVCIVVSLVRKYYLFFSIWDVFQFYKIPQFTTSILISMIGDIVIKVSGFNVDNILIYSLTLIFTICNIYCGTIILFKIKQILFGEKIELSLLRELHKVFWYNKIDLTNLGDEENWNRDSIYLNLEYLLECYLNDKVNEVASIEFVSTLDIIKEKYYKKVIYILVVNNCLLILALFFQDDFDIYTKIQISTLIGVTILGVLGIEEIKLAIVKMIKGTSGYALKTKEDKYIIVTRFGLITRKRYKSFVEDMNSICAFFFIWIKKNEKQDLSMCKQEFINFINCLDGKEKSLSYLPVFTIGFFLWDRELYVEEVKLVYHRFAIDKESSVALQKMIYSQIIYVTRNFEGKSREKLDDYLLWLKGC